MTGIEGHEEAEIPLSSARPSPEYRSPWKAIEPSKGPWYWRLPAPVWMYMMAAASLFFAVDESAPAVCFVLGAAGSVLLTSYAGRKHVALHRRRLQSDLALGAQLAEFGELEAADACAHHFFERYGEAGLGR